MSEIADALRHELRRLEGALIPEHERIVRLRRVKLNQEREKLNAVRLAAQAYEKTATDEPTSAEIAARMEAGLRRAFQMKRMPKP